ncbi:MAG: ABC transporter permease [Deltaproteobacteria bacterium]|jgi:cell division transport system permease protein|nr:ABC transporter permease [Deltaproteobacteria bacterium]
MKANHIFYLLRATYQNIRQHLVINLISILTIAFSLVVFGAYFFGYLNLQQTLSRWRADIQVIAYLKDDISRRQLQQLETFCRRQPEVAKVVYVSKKEALQRFRESLGQGSRLLEGLEDNPLPASLEINLREGVRELPVIEKLTARLAARPGVEELQYGQQWIAKFYSVLNLLNIFALGITGFLFFVTVFIVSNTIKLSFYSRRETVDIMELVGATRSYIAVPYLLESLFQGAVASLVALGILYSLYFSLAQWLQERFYFLQGVVAVRFFPPLVLAAFILLGVGLGLLGFLVSFRWLRGS